jgi:gas vesicle protein
MKKSLNQNNTSIMSVSSKFLGGLLVGTAFGVVTGMLMAPTSGNQARKNIVRKSKVYSQQAIDAVRQYLENMKGKAKEASTGSAELIDRLKQDTAL